MLLLPQGWWESQRLVMLAAADACLQQHWAMLMQLCL
jgi:hypothetical protein